MSWYTVGIIIFGNFLYAKIILSVGIAYPATWLICDFLNLNVLPRLAPSYVCLIFMIAMVTKAEYLQLKTRIFGGLAGYKTR